MFPECTEQVRDVEEKIVNIFFFFKTIFKSFFFFFPLQSVQYNLYEIPIFICMGAIGKRKLS